MPLHYNLIRDGEKTNLKLEAFMQTFPDSTHAIFNNCSLLVPSREIREAIHYFSLDEESRKKLKESKEDGQSHTNLEKFKDGYEQLRQAFIIYYKLDDGFTLKDLDDLFTSMDCCNSNRFAWQMIIGPPLRLLMKSERPKGSPFYPKIEIKDSAKKCLNTLGFAVVEHQKEIKKNLSEGDNPEKNQQTVAIDDAISGEYYPDDNAPFKTIHVGMKLVHDENNKECGFKISEEGSLVYDEHWNRCSGAGDIDEKKLFDDSVEFHDSQLPLKKIYDQITVEQNGQLIKSSKNEKSEDDDEKIESIKENDEEYHNRVENGFENLKETVQKAVKQLHKDLIKSFVEKDILGKIIEKKNKETSNQNQEKENDSENSKELELNKVKVDEEKRESEDEYMNDLFGYFSENDQQSQKEQDKKIKKQEMLNEKQKKDDKNREDLDKIGMKQGELCTNLRKCAGDIVFVKEFEQIMGEWEADPAKNKKSVREYYLEKSKRLALLRLADELELTFTKLKDQNNARATAVGLIEVINKHGSKLVEHKHPKIAQLLDDFITVLLTIVVVPIALIRKKHPQDDNLKDKEQQNKNPPEPKNNSFVKNLYGKAYVEFFTGKTDLENTLDKFVDEIDTTEKSESLVKKM